MKQIIFVFLLFYSLIANAQMCTIEPSGDASSSTSNCSTSLSAFISNHLGDLVPTSSGSGILKFKVNFVIAQDAMGEGNFKLSDPDHVAFLNLLASRMNYTLANLTSICTCGSPANYPTAKIELDVNLIEIQDDFAWNHLHDSSTSTNSQNKSYLNYIDNLVGTTDAFNVLITTDSINYDHFVVNGGSAPWPSTRYGGGWYSGFPTNLVLNRPSMCHIPDLFVSYYVNTTVPYPYTLGAIDQYNIFAAKGILHEIGHYWNLMHDNACDDNMMDTDCSGTAPCEFGSWRSTFEGCQVREAFLSLTAKNVRNCVECTTVLDHNIDIVTNETWDNDLRIYGNIVVKSGNTLRITCVVNMQPDAQIIVERGAELIVDGGKIYTSCSSKWKGIIVEGDASSSQSSAGLVQLMNNAIIENAIVGISCNPTHIAWPNTSYYGGLVKADDATIINCNKAAEFMRYGVGVFTDQSYYKNVLFQDVRTGVTIWESNGITFDACEFINVLYDGILPLDSHIEVNDWLFNNATVGVSVESTMAIPSATEIGTTAGNKFYNYDVAIEATAVSNGTSFKVENNQFFGPKVGVQISGYSEYMVDQNNFSDHYISTLLHTTDNGVITSVSRNCFVSSDYGSVVNNSNYQQYLDNGFYSTSTNDIILSKGSIYPTQGSIVKDAGNCFTLSGIPDIYTYLSTPFTYYVYTGHTSFVCKTPVFPGPGTPNGNYTLASGGLTASNIACGVEGGGGGHGEKFMMVETPTTVEGAQSLIVYLAELIEQLEETAPNNPDDMNTLTFCKSDISKMRAYVISLMRDSGDENWVSNAIDYANLQPDFHSNSFAYGLLVQSGNFSDARLWIQNLVASTEEISDFKTIQNINLDYLENVNQYVLSESDQQTLYDLGQKDLPLNGYARSLYYVLTGERIPLVVSLGEEEIVLRSVSPEKGMKVNAFPNPSTKGQITFKIDSVSEDNEFELVIYSMQGHLMVDVDDIKIQSIIIDSSQWPSGLYGYVLRNKTTSELVSSKIIVH